MVPPLVYSGLQITSILNKTYRFGQPIIFFQKVETLRLLKIHNMFCPQGEPKKKVSANGLILMCRGAHIHYFKINPPTFCCPLFSENYLNPQVRINKIVNKHTANYQLSYFYGLLRALSLRSLYFLEFSPKPVYSTMVAEKFQIYSVKTTANTFLSQKTESAQFYSYPQAKLSPKFLSLSPRQTGIAHSTQTAFSEDIFS